MILQTKIQKLPRNVHDTLFILLTISFILLPAIQIQPIWSSILVLLAIFWRSMIAIKGWRFPPSWFNILILLSGILATFFTYKSFLSRDADVTMIFILMAMKLLEMRFKRDIYIVLFLGFFILLTNFFYSQSILIAIFSLICFWGLITALINSNLSDVKTDKSMLKNSMILSNKIILLSMPMMAILFISFPRNESMWNFADKSFGKSGLSNEMTIGNISELTLDRSIAMNVKFIGKMPLLEEIYFRGPVLSNFDGKNWSPLDIFARFRSSVRDLVVKGQKIKYKITLEPNNNPWLLMLDVTPVAPTFTYITKSNFELDSIENIFDQKPMITTDLQWLIEKPLSQRLTYTGESYLDYEYGPKTASIEMQSWLNLPYGYNPRTIEMALKIKKELPTNLKDDNEISNFYINKALDKLKNDGYQYTTSPGVYGKHTADEFWFDKKAGFCEHIASSFVILMRALNVPARIVTGYQGGEFNIQSNSLIVRQSDAHAWAEVWLEDKGWVRIDPTASVSPMRLNNLKKIQNASNDFWSNIFQETNQKILKDIKEFFNKIETNWGQSILEYSTNNQNYLLNKVLSIKLTFKDYLYGFLVVSSIIIITFIGKLFLSSQKDQWANLLEKFQNIIITENKNNIKLTPHQLMIIVEEKITDDDHIKYAMQWLNKMEQFRYMKNTKLNMKVTFSELNRDFKILKNQLLSNGKKK